MDLAKRQKIRESVPNIRALRKTLAHIQKYRLTHGVMSSSEIERAENSFEFKEQIVHKYKDQNTLEKKAEIIRNLFISVPKYISKSEKELDSLQTDMLFCYIAYGFEPDEYVYCDLEGNDFSYRSRFVSNRDQKLYHCVLNDLIDTAVVFDKAHTYEKFVEFFRRDVVVVSDQNDYEKFIQFVDRHPVFVKKKVYVNLGKGIDKVDSSTYHGDLKSLFRNVVLGGG